MRRPTFYIVSEESYDNKGTPRLVTVDIDEAFEFANSLLSEDERKDWMTRYIFVHALDATSDCLNMWCLRCGGDLTGKWIVRVDERWVSYEHIPAPELRKERIIEAAEILMTQAVEAGAR